MGHVGWFFAVDAGAWFLLACITLAFCGVVLFVHRLSRVPTLEAIEQRGAALVRITRAELRR